jgi:predicted helicase
MSIARINQYYKELEDIYMFSGQNNETSIRRATANLISDYAKDKHLMLVDEIKLPHLKKVPDGGLQDTLKFNYGYWEAKDTNDDLEKEITHKINIGYPTENLLVEDTVTAVLIRGDLREYCDMKDAKALDKFLIKFVSFVRKEVLVFREALAKFAKETPKIIKVLESMIAAQASSNLEFKQKRQTFYALCQKVINPTVTLANVDEMLIQHILTEEIFFSIVGERQFHEDNNISQTLTDIEKSFFVKDAKRQVLATLKPYYEAVQTRATALTTHEEKQDFLKVIYENFYKAYNPANADRLGIVYTPSAVVKFMIESTEYLLEKYFEKTLASKGVEILDPATGTGTFITDIIKHLPTNALEYKYAHEIHANEVAILPYYIANLNIEYIYKQCTGGEYAEFKNLCFVDTLDNVDALTFAGKQNDMFSALAENALRIKAQNDRKISIIIGNPPYNAKQDNFNDQNANRAYKEIDKQIKATFVKQGSAQNQIVLYDMYVRFYRWAMNRIDAKDGGIVAFITNRSFIDSRTFDGFRKCAQADFQEIYIVDLMGDVRQNNTAVQGGNVFNIMTGVAIAFFIKIKDSDRKKARIHYYNVGEGLSAKDKLDSLKDNKLKDLDFERISPDAKANWINQTDNDWEELIKLCSKDAKSGKGNETIFELFSGGIKTQRDEWVYDFDKQNLANKIQYFTKVYEASRQDENFKDKYTIKWDRELENYANRDIKKKFDAQQIVKAIYRPFVKQYLYFDKHFNGMTYRLGSIFPNAHTNKVIWFKSGVDGGKFYLAVNCIPDVLSNGGSQCLPLYRYDVAGKQIENITDWALGVFHAHYQNPQGFKNLVGLEAGKQMIEKEDIFHYVYAVLHAPAYREKYAQNLKRDFPRLPLYADFWKYAQAGKELMALHLNYETLPTLGEVKTLPIESVLPKRKASPTYEAEQAELIKNYVPEVKLKVKDGNIEIDSLTTITGVPALAYQYKLGNRSAIEWVLDQYKPYKSSDETIQSNFNNYRFSDYKQEVIDLLLRVIQVSVRTMEIVGTL